MPFCRPSAWPPRPAAPLAPGPEGTRRPFPALAGLRVLLSNDDSMQAARTSHSDGLGLYEIRKALCGAGADVVVMAPWQVQSGKGPPSPTAAH
ncbi:hypothetical protein [Streptomyces sp. RKAG290]|uniref:hypothetical protein n=1 Tax=Streptomyces sp. RKAG290 TaxID=2888348 RepID=UPI0035A8E6AB